METQYRVIELLQELKSLIVGKPKQDRWVGISDASKFCGLSIQTLRRNVKVSKLKASTSTGKLLFKVQDLEDFLTGTKN